MNSVIKAGEVFKLADLLPYQEGRIVNMDIVNNDSMKFVVMSFDKGTGLSEHAAPGEAIIFALDGEAVITYEGVDHEKLWDFVPTAKVGDSVSSGDIIGEVQETAIVSHKIMVPYGVNGTIKSIKNGKFNVLDTIAVIETANGDVNVKK